MNKKKHYTFFITTLLLLCLEIYCKSFDNFYKPNILLTFLAYLLYKDSPLYQNIITIICIECIALLQTGANGLSFMILMPLILQFQTINRVLYRKFLAPFIFIFVYKVLYELTLCFLFSHTFNYIHICIQTTINYTTFLILYNFFHKQK